MIEATTISPTTLSDRQVSRRRERINSEVREC